MLRPLALLVLLIAAVLGRAGSYAAVVYSGGTAYTNTGFPIAYKKNANTDGWGSDGATFASCGGEVTATFTWQPAYTGEPAPPVVADEWCVANHGWADGTCDSAFSDPEVNMTRGGTLQSPIHHYSIKQPVNGVVTLKHTPTAVAGAMSAYYYGFCSVAYHAGVSPVTLTLTGVHDSSINDILVGQTLGGRVDCGLSSANDAYTWNVSGCDPFQSFNIFTSQQTSPQYGTQASPSSSSVTLFTTQHGSSLSTHLRTKGQFTVTCVYYCAVVKTSITLSTKGVAKGPSDSWGATIQLPRFAPNSTNPAGIVLTDSSLQAAGILFDGTVATPGEFISHDGPSYGTGAKPS